MDCSLDDSGESSRLLNYFQAARLWNLVTGSRTSSSSSSSSSQQQSVAVAAEQPTSSTSSSSRKRHQSSAKSNTADAVATDSIQSHPILTHSDSLAAVEAEPPPRSTAAAGPAAAAATAAAPTLSPMRQRLTQADASAQLSAELRLPRLSVYVPDGQLLLPQELNGRQQVTELAEELEEDSSWLAAQQQQQQQTSAAVDGSSSEGGHNSDAPSAEAAAAVAAAEAAGWRVPPEGVSSSSWSRALPVLLQVSGERVQGLLRGWRLGPDSYLLQQPAHVTWQFSPELARLSLSQFNPFLEGVVNVKEGGQLLSTYTPEGGQLPALRGQVHVAPMKLRMSQGSLLRQVQQLLGVSQGGGAGGFMKRSWLSDAPAGVDVWTGPLLVSVEGPGLYRTSRTDMIIGSGSSALHVALWGLMDTTTDTIDMRIGLTAATLAKAGIRGLPASYVLPLAVRGHLDSPQIDWQAAVRKLAVLSAMQLGRDAVQQQQQLGPGQGAAAAGSGQAAAGGAAGVMPGLFGAANRALSNAASSFIGQVDQRLQQELQEVPPAGELPWEQPGSSQQ
ncbi:hypothetical protein COO60DRAFT_1676044 [Scenedesmus sp. NREL 46B-D3]|nr:hypothetical protein COO60DRAFT_1676044 [Scenedesmus sp. NREL 46B-D3]